MDRRIMDLSNSQINSCNHDLIDFMNRSSEKKDDTIASYDFMNSSIRIYDSRDADKEPAKFALGNNQKPANASLDASLVSEIDSTVKKYTDNLMHAIDGLSARVSHLETKTRNLENSVVDLKVSLGNNYGSNEGKLRQVESILREVLTGVNVIKDKQEVVEAQLLVAKLQIPKVEQNVESQNSPYIGFSQPAHQQSSTTPPPPHQLATQFPQYPPPGQTPENPNLQYQIHPPHQHHPPPNAPPTPPTHLPPDENPSNPNLQYQLPPPRQQNQYPSPSQPHPSFSSLNPLPPQQPPHHPEETPHAPPQFSPPPSSQQFYGPAQTAYNPPSNGLGPGYAGPFGPTSGHGEPFPYSSGPHMKPHQLPSPAIGQSGGSGYPHLPTARLLPQSPSTGGGGGPGSSGSGSSGPGNRVPIDDVVDKVTKMGFSREQVRGTVRKLTENGQAVDLNIVLDKLMNDGEGRVWFDR